MQRLNMAWNFVSWKKRSIASKDLEDTLDRLNRPDGYEIKPTLLLPSASSQLPGEWRRIAADGFDDVHWTYADNAPVLTCNGIVVDGPGNDPGAPVSQALAQNMSYSMHRLMGTSIPFKVPKVSCFDSKGTLALNLARTRNDRRVSIPRPAL